MAKSMDVEPLIREALERAVADPGPRKLHGTKANPGIFLSSSGAAKAAAQQAVERGLIVARGEQRTKTKSVPLYGLAPAGVTYLLEHDPVRQLLSATRDGVEQLTRQAAAGQQTLLQVQQQLAQLRTVVQESVARVASPDVSRMLAAAQPAAAAPCTSEPRAAGPHRELADEIVRFVQEQKRQAPLRPIDLPQLYRVVRARQPGLTLGQFHDLLRGLAEARRIRLSPFTQAMYQLAEPECALLVGREVMYYVDAP